MIGIKELTKLRKIINFRQLCKDAGISYDTMIAKTKNQSELNIDVSKRISSALLSYGIIIKTED